MGQTHVEESNPALTVAEKEFLICLKEDKSEPLGFKVEWKPKGQKSKFVVSAVLIYKTEEIMIVRLIMFQRRNFVPHNSPSEISFALNRDDSEWETFVFLDSDQNPLGYRLHGWVPLRNHIDVIFMSDQLDMKIINLLHGEKGK